MAKLAQIIFTSMIVLIVVFATIIILFLVLALTGRPSESSTVESSNRFPVANIWEDVLLSCFLRRTSEELVNPSDVSITWEKAGLSGVVYKYRDGFADLDDQSLLFRGRTQLFAEAVTSGNASLQLRNVRMLDSGTYTCTVQAPNGEGSVHVHLKTAAFSAPVFTIEEDILTAVAPRWFPKPDVTWYNRDGNVMNASTNVSQTSAGMFYVASSVQPVTVQDAYSCTIRNDLVTSVTEATITESGVSDRTFFTFSATSSILTFGRLNMISSVLLTVCYVI